MTDPISDMLTRIRNANRIESPAGDMPCTKEKVTIAQVLKDEGFVIDYQVGKMVPNEQGRSTFQPSVEPAAIAHFYRVPTFESIGGRALAESVANEIRVIDGFHPEVVGMRLPILRETKMPAVLVTIGSARAVSDASNELVECVFAVFCRSR